MKLNKILMEVPLPDDWDKEVYQRGRGQDHRKSSYANMIRYARDRAKRLGGGSSRIAFMIEYEGRPTALKIAKNAKGLAQNDFESQMLEDYYYKDLGLAIPLIDYDEDNDPPVWIHTEMAEKMKPSQFKKFMGGLDEFNLLRFIDYFTGKGTYTKPDSDVLEKWEQLYEDNEYLNALVDICGNYNIPPADFGRVANWGIFKGKPVIIDIGHSSDVMTKYYSLPRR